MRYTVDRGLCRLLMIALLALTPIVAQAEYVPKRNSQRELELVRQYVRTHESVKGKAFYQAVSGLGALTFGLSGPAKGAVGTALNLFFIGIGGVTTGHAIYYAASGGQLLLPSAIVTYDDEVGLDPSPHQAGPPVVLSREQVQMVRQYIDDNRSYFSRVFNQGVIGLALLMADSLPGAGHMPLAIHRLADLTGMVIIGDSLIHWISKGRITLMGHQIDRVLGIPKPEDLQINVVDTLQTLAHLPPDQAQERLVADPQARAIVSVAAQIIDQDPHYKLFKFEQDQ